MKHSKDRFHQSAPDKLELHKGGGCQGCFGIPFFGAGIFMLLVVAQVIPLSNAGDLPWWAWLAILFMALTFTAVGGALVFGRSWITINKTQRRIWMAWGLLRPMKGKVYDLDSYRTVCLKLVAGDSDTADSYMLALKGDNEIVLDIVGIQDFSASYAQAELLTAFLGFPLEDFSSGHPQILNQSQINELSSNTPAVQSVEPVLMPEKIISKIEATPTGIKISVPGPAFNPLRLLGLLFPLVLWLVFGAQLLFFFRSSYTPLAVQYVFIGFLSIVFFIFPLLGIIGKYFASKRMHSSMEVDAQALTLTQKRIGKKGQLTIPRERIIAVDYGTSVLLTQAALNSQTTSINIPAWVYRLQRFIPSRGLTIKSKDGIFYFGAGLPHAEIYYLYSIVKSYLKPEANK